MVGAVRRAPRPSQRGFKLLEVLVAMTVLGVTAAGLMGLHVGAIHGIAESGSMSTAMDIATQRAELYLLEGDAALVTRGCDATPTGCAATPPNPDDGIDDPDCAAVVDGAQLGLGATPTGRYRYDTTVNALDGAQTGGYEARVTVCWREPTGAVRRVETRRLVAPRERG